MRKKDYNTMPHDKVIKKTSSPRKMGKEKMDMRNGRVKDMGKNVRMVSSSGTKKMPKRMMKRRETSEEKLAVEERDNRKEMRAQKRMKKASKGSRSKMSKMRSY